MIAFLVLLNIFYLVKQHFSGEEELKIEVSHLNKEIEQKELERQIALHRSKVFRQQVAKIIPEYIQKAPKNFRIRNLASVVNEDIGDILPLEKATEMMEDAKYHFQAEQWLKVIAILDRLVELYPNSVHGVEANFLLMESLYQTNELEECLEQIERMLSLYPENPLAGFSMIRMGNILERYDRIDDAIGIYNKIISIFPKEKVLIRQAKKMLEDLQ